VIKLRKVTVPPSLLSHRHGRLCTEIVVSTVMLTLDNSKQLQAVIVLLSSSLSSKCAQTCAYGVIYWLLYGYSWSDNGSFNREQRTALSNPFLSTVHNNADEKLCRKNERISMKILVSLPLPRLVWAAGVFWQTLWYSEVGGKRCWWQKIDGLSLPILPVPVDGGSGREY